MLPRSSSRRCSGLRSARSDKRSVRMIPRRIFLRDGAAAVVGLSAVPGFLLRTLEAAQPATTRGKKLVVLFLRGGADGLNTVVPFGEPSYYDYRPNIAIPAPGKG